VGRGREPVVAYEPLYLEGIECFNRRDYFESHEVWEDLWRVSEGPVRLFYKGLIQAAVALHHLDRGNLRGATRLLAGCTKYLADYRPRYLGLDVAGFLEKMDQCVSQCVPGDLAEDPRRPVICLSPDIRGP